MPELQLKLLSLAAELGFDRAGICSAEPPTTAPFLEEWVAAGLHAQMEFMRRSLELRRTLESVLPGVRSAIVCSLNYNAPNPRRPGYPRIARYALGRDYHKVLRGKLKALASAGANLLPGAKFRPCVDSAPVIERELATRAGLGWQGKNTMLIDSLRGSWFVLGVLLTDAQLAPSMPASGGCGTCRKCIDACPTGAIVQREGRWQVDSRLCISYLTIEHRGPIPAKLHPGIGDWTFGCDTCQEVCPFNTPRPTQPLRARTAAEPDFASARSWPSLEEIVNWSYERWDLATAGSAVRRAGYQGLKRNALINLRNAERLKPRPSD